MYFPHTFRILRAVSTLATRLGISLITLLLQYLAEQAKLGLYFTGVPSESNLKVMSWSFQGQTGKNCYHDFQMCPHLKEPELQSGGM